MKKNKASGFRAQVPFIAVGVAVVIAFTTILLVDGKRVCNANQMRCKDGKKCVNTLDVCDHEAHCADRSDEDENFCNGNFTGLTRSVSNECKPGMYRCRFGGCVEATKLCNSQTDCYDGSDETPDLCKRNRCRGKKFRCNYGGCIRASLKCNGRAECEDSSDETRHACKNFTCGLGQFQCKYGACINSTLTCNGKPDCMDKSDESDDVCKVLVSAELPGSAETPFGVTVVPNGKVN